MLTIVIEQHESKSVQVLGVEAVLVDDAGDGLDDGCDYVDHRVLCPDDECHSRPVGAETETRPRVANH